MQKSRTRRSDPRRWAFRLRLSLLVLAALGIGGSGRAQNLLTAGDVVLEDAIGIDVLGRYLYAFSSRGGGRNEFELELDEEILFKESRGQVGLVVTNRRLLAISSLAGGWRVLPLRLAEQRKTQQWLASRVALAVSPQRIMGFDGGSGTWLQVDVGPNERTRKVALGSSTALAVTDNNAYGMSPNAGGFFLQPLRIQEKLESVTADASLGRVLTSQRLLIFKANSGAWSVTRRNIN